VSEAPYRDDEAGMTGVVVASEATAAGTAACVVISGSAGGQELSLLLARELAKAGIHALGLAYHGADGLQPTLRDVPLEGFARAARWLQEQTGLASEQVALVGLSRGSEAAMLTGAHFDDVRGRIVGVVPGNVVAGSWPPGGAAWLLDDEPLPYVEIPVERVDELLLVSAGQDEIWPSGPMADAIVSRRAQHGLATEHVHLPDAGHLCLDPSDHDDGAPWAALVRFVRRR
jgi:dienelactone hydrolase